MMPFLGKNFAGQHQAVPQQCILRRVLQNPKRQEQPAKAGGVVSMDEQLRSEEQVVLEHDPSNATLSSSRKCPHFRDPESSAFRHPNETYKYFFLLRRSGMRKGVIFAIAITILLLVAACSSQMKAKPLTSRTTPRTPNAAVVAETQPATEPEEGLTAAEAIEDLRSGGMPLPTAGTGAKEGSTGLPPAPAGVTGKDALKARTKALYSQGTSAGNIEADRDFGSRFDDLPEGYGDSDSAGE
jgi:hypothetical protein